MTNSDNKRLAIFDRIVLRSIFVAVYNTDLRTFEKRINDDLYKLYEKPKILSYLRIKRMVWTYIWRDENNIYIYIFKLKPSIKDH